MAQTRAAGGRTQKVATFQEGPDSADRFLGAVRAVLTVPKERIVELEKEHKKKSKRR